MLRLNRRRLIIITIILLGLGVIVISLFSQTTYDFYVTKSKVLEEKVRVYENHNSEIINISFGDQIRFYSQSHKLLRKKNLVFDNQGKWIYLAHDEWFPAPPGMSPFEYKKINPFHKSLNNDTGYHLRVKYLPLHSISSNSWSSNSTLGDEVLCSIENRITINNHSTYKIKLYLVTSFYTKKIISQLFYLIGKRYFTTEWWSPELGLVAFDTPTSGVFYLETIDHKTARKIFR